jgi:hypothetical protein
VGAEQEAPYKAALLAPGMRPVSRARTATNLARLDRINEPGESGGSARFRDFGLANYLEVWPTSAAVHRAGAEPRDGPPRPQTRRLRPCARYRRRPAPCRRGEPAAVAVGRLVRRIAADARLRRELSPCTFVPVPGSSRSHVGPEPVSTSCRGLRGVAHGEPSGAPCPTLPSRGSSRPGVLTAPDRSCRRSPASVARSRRQHRQQRCPGAHRVRRRTLKRTQRSNHCV